MSEVAGAVRPPAPGREPPSPRAVLRAAGIAEPGAIEGAELHDVSRSHSVTLAQLPDGSAFVVKRVSPEARAAGRSLGAELFAYRLASWNSSLASALPEPVHLDERNQLVALVAGRPDHLYPAQCLQPGFPSVGLAAALGRALAVVHSATDGVPLASVAACGVVELPDTPREDRWIPGGSTRAAELADAVVAEEALAEPLRRTAAALRPRCLVHADVKWDNALLDPGPPAQVRLFDWELSGLGDPAWDVGAALADTLALTVRLHGNAALPADPATWLTASSQALLAAYGQPEDEGFAQVVVGCWVARTVHLALECASGLDATDHPAVQELLEAARRLAGSAGALTGAVHDGLRSAG